MSYTIHNQQQAHERNHIKYNLQSSNTLLLDNKHYHHLSPLYMTYPSKYLSTLYGILLLIEWQIVHQIIWDQQFFSLLLYVDVFCMAMVYFLIEDSARCDLFRVYVEFYIWDCLLYTITKSATCYKNTNKTESLQSSVPKFCRCKNLSTTPCTPFLNFT